MIGNGNVKSESDLARKLFISRVHVNHFTRLLKLDPEVIKALEALGDPLPRRIVTERMLRPYLSRSANEQREMISALLNNRSHNAKSQHLFGLNKNTHTNGRFMSGSNGRHPPAQGTATRPCTLDSLRSKPWTFPLTSRGRSYPCSS